MALVNFVTYTIIPFYITRSGATLLNLSNVTTIVWSMLFDIVLYNSSFYPICLIAFIIELVAIIVFSTREPKKKLNDGAMKEPERNENTTKSIKGDII